MHDFALLKLEKSLKFDEKTNEICIAKCALIQFNLQVMLIIYRALLDFGEADGEVKGQEFVAAGWGRAKVFSNSLPTSTKAGKAKKTHFSVGNAAATLFWTKRSAFSGNRLCPGTIATGPLENGVPLWPLHAFHMWHSVVVLRTFISLN